MVHPCNGIMVNPKKALLFFIGPPKAMRENQHRPLRRAGSSCFLSKSEPDRRSWFNSTKSCGTSNYPVEGPETPALGTSRSTWPSQPPTHFWPALRRPAKRSRRKAHDQGMALEEVLFVESYFVWRWCCFWSTWCNFVELYAVWSYFSREAREAKGNGSRLGFPPILGTEIGLLPPLLSDCQKQN